MRERVLVTDAEERAVLAACRGLHAGGFAVSACASHVPAAAHFSRTVSRRHRVPDPRVVPREWVARVEAIVRSEPHAALVAGTDAALTLVSEHRDRLEPDERLGLPPHEVVLRALDKIAMLDAAAAGGLDAPQSVTGETANDARAA